MKLLVQDYLKTHSLEQLKEEHAVNYRLHGYKFSLNYDQIKVDNNNPLSKQCRGLILAPSHATERMIVNSNGIIGDTVVLARPMDRFFNFGQVEAASVNFEAKSTRFFEKLDGTLSILYWDRFINEWHVATRSVSEADLPIDGFGNMTFRNLFEKAICETSKFDSFKDWLESSSLNIDYTYVFELCTPANRVVVKHDEYRVYLIAVRRTNDGFEYDINSEIGHINIPVCKNYKLGSLSEMLEFVAGRDPLDHEGIVAVDKNYNRVKVKNSGYLALSRVKDSALRSNRALLELCLLGCLDDALPLLPEHVVTRATTIRESLRTFLINLESKYKICLSAVDPNVDNREKQKQMALAVKNHNGWMAYMMMRFSGKVSSFEDFLKLQINSFTKEYNKNFLDYFLNLLKP